jgi:hypothetical protein
LLVIKRDDLRAFLPSSPQTQTAAPR